MAESRADQWRSAGARGRQGSSGRRPPRSGQRRRRLRAAAPCTVCGGHIEEGTEAVWNYGDRTATCLPCAEAVAVEGAEAGTAGGSARHEAERRRQAQQARTGERWSLARRRSEPDDSARWVKGAAGEERLGVLLDRLASKGTIAVLHDRALPRSRANLDHLAITAGGVWIIDAKNYRGRIEVDEEGSGSRPGPRLRIDGRDRTERLISGTRWQLDHVRQALDLTYREVPVHLAVCFVDAKRQLGGRATLLDGALVTWGKDIVKRLGQPGPFDQRWRNAIQHHLATRFRPAAGESR